MNFDRFKDSNQKVKNTFFLPEASVFQIFADFEIVELVMKISHILIFIITKKPKTIFFMKVSFFAFLEDVCNTFFKSFQFVKDTF